jgi:two-component system chemotaxis sensor kinase CheA
MELDLQAVTEIFLDEAQEGLAAMEQALLALESRPRDREAIGTLFRVAHTIKGNAGSLGFTGVAEFTHVLEDVLDDLREERREADPPLVTLLLEAVDALRAMIPAAAEGEHPLTLDHRVLLERLRSVGADLPLPGSGEARPSATTVMDAREAERDRTLRVDIRKLDRMLTLTGEIAIAQGRLRQMLAHASGADGDVVEAHAEAERLCLDLQEIVLDARMVPLGPLFHRYARTVRDLSATQGRRARLVLEGEDVEVDTAVAEHIRDPLTHMVRNALDHGIEPPAVRERLGKDPCGRISLRARHDAGSIVVEVEDDGAGLDRSRIARRARSSGLLAEPEALTDAELCRLVLEPGFSTAEAVTELSGRGIGLDVVRRSIEALRGTVAIESVADRGTLITLRLPLTLAHIRGLVVRAAGETLIIPLDGVIECLELPADCNAGAQGRGVVSLRGQALPFVRLRRLFDLGGEPPARELVVVVRHGREQAGLAVDEVLGESQNVIKPMGTLFRKLAGVAGSTILGDGRVALILDLPTLLRRVS